jgi:DNA-binding transcriptional LysR family regulator
MLNNIGLKYFVGVAKVGSIRKAAEQLHVAASAISRQIQLLEDEIGAPLIERHRGQKTIKLTASGELVLEYARLMDNELDELRAQVRAIDSLQRGSVRLGVSEGFTRAFLPAFLQRFRTQYPGITFQVTTYGAVRLAEMLVEDIVDIVLAYGVPESLDVRVAKQVFFRPCLLVPVSHPLAARRAVDLSECADLEFAFPDETLSTRSEYVRMFAKAQVKPRLVITTNSYELTRAVAAAGGCVAIVNRDPGREQPPRGTRYVPLKGDGVEQWPLKLCVHTGRSLSVAARLCVDQLSAAIDAEHCD